MKPSCHPPAVVAAHPAADPRPTLRRHRASGPPWRFARIGAAALLLAAAIRSPAQAPPAPEPAGAPAPKPEARPAKPGKAAPGPGFQALEISADFFELQSKPAESPPGQTNAVNIATAFYRGNVRARDPQMNLDCERLTVKLPTSGGRIDSILAEENVVIELLDDKGQKTRAKGARAVYTSTVTAGATNDVVELTGDARSGPPTLETEQGTLTGDVVLLDRATGRLQARGNVKMKLRPEALQRFAPPDATKPKPAPKLP
jgi:lipopolysaccharide export system protein LptA